MKFWQDGVEKDQCEEDRLFLKSMKSDRKASIGSFDRVYQKQQEKKQQRQEADMTQNEREKKRQRVLSNCFASWKDLDDKSEESCRHHMGEIVLTHVWDSLKTEASSGPDISLFKRFQANFQSYSL